MIKLLVNKMPSHTFVSDCPFMDADKSRFENCVLGDRACPLYGDSDIDRKRCEYLMDFDEYTRMEN